MQTAKQITVFLLVFLSFYHSKAGKNIPIIILNDQTINQSLAKQTIILEDKEKKLTIQDILSDSTLVFQPAHNNVENFNFTTSGWWIRFKVQNKLEKEILFLLETARPVTNKAILFQVSGTNVIRTYYAGDNIPYEKRSFKHRKSIFKIQLNDDSPKDFVLYLESDGEVITMPLVFWKTEDFMSFDYNNQLFQGLYYGVLIFVAIIYFFFYIALRSKAFLYYVLYVIFMAMLQFSLDGMAYEYFFPTSPYWADHFVLLSASLAVFFVLLFGNNYLKLPQYLPRLSKFYKILIALVGLIAVMALIPGPTFAAMYPTVNAISLFSTVLTLITIIYLKAKKMPVDWFFIFAFALLVVAVVIFILGNFNVIENKTLTESILKVGSSMEIIFLSLSLAQKYREIQEQKEQAQADLLVQMKETAKIQEDININLEREVAERTKEVVHQKKEIEEINKEMVDSINYARRIQEAILPPQDLVEETIPDSFVYYQPRDIVSGDFYFISPVRTTDESMLQLSLFAAADCTGHGVPGAFMSILGTNFLKASLKEKAINSPADALDFLNLKIHETLSQKSSNNMAVRDGMDIALCALNRKSGELHFAGANLPCWIVTNVSGTNEIVELKPDKNPIGNIGVEVKFTDNKYLTKKGDMIYVFSDGYADQFGGANNKKFKYSKLKELLLSIADKPAEEQRTILHDTIVAWKGKFQQTDDVLVIGVRV